MSIIDVTMLNTYAYNTLIVDGWRVLSDETFSDHKYIHFSVDFGSGAPKRLRNWKKGRWGELARLTSDVSPLPKLKWTIESLDECASELERFIRGKLDQVCPEKATREDKPALTAWRSRLDDGVRIVRPRFDSG